MVPKVDGVSNYVFSIPMHTFLKQTFSESNFFTLYLLTLQINFVRVLFFEEKHPSELQMNVHFPVYNNREQIVYYTIEKVKEVLQRIA